MAGLADVSAPPIALVNPPDPPDARAVREGAGGLGSLASAGGFAYPPHMLAACAAALRREGTSCHLVDAVGAGWSPAQTLAEIPMGGIAVVQVGYRTREADAAFLAALRARDPAARVLLIGPDAGDPMWLERGLGDAVLLGEPELALPAAIQALRAGARGALTPRALGVPGYDARGWLVDLDALPYPAWELTPWRAYGFLSLFSSRGCPDGCRYCPYVVALGDRVRARSVEGVLAEMRWLAERFAPPRVLFRDPVFARERARVLALCAGIRRMGLRLAWECESRPEHFDRELLAAMRAAGCTTVKIGVESADPELLVRLGRVADIDQAREYVRQAAGVVRDAVAVGLICRVFVMVGLPGESDLAVRRTADFLRRLPDAARVHIKPFVRYPGVKLPAAPPARDDRLAVLREALAARQAGLWARMRSWIR